MSDNNQAENSNGIFDAEKLVTNVFNGVPWIDYLIRYRKVEEETWKSIGLLRLNKIHYLLPYRLDPIKKEVPVINDLKYIYYEENSIACMGELGDFLGFIPNIKLVDFGNVTRWDIWISEALRSHSKLCALRFINDQWLRLMTPEMADKTFYHIRFLSSPICDAYKLVRHAKSLEQLFIPELTSREVVETILLRAPRLRRFHFTMSFSEIIKPGSSHNRPANGVEMVEIGLVQSDHQLRHLEILLNKFRQIKNLYLHIASHKFEGNPNNKTTPLHTSLESLVITFSGSVIIRDWVGFEMFILKCKNLRHLAIRNCCILTPNDIARLIERLPKLTVFDCRGCTQIKRPIAQIVTPYPSSKIDRIVFVQNDSQCRLPSPSTIQLGFDFMLNVFYQEFSNIPQFLFR